MTTPNTLGYALMWILYVGSKIWKPTLVFSAGYVVALIVHKYGLTF